MSQALGKWLKQTPVILPMFTPSPSGKSLVVSSKLKKLVWFTKLFYLALLVMAITFIVSTIVVNEQSFKKAIVDRLSGTLQVSGSDECYLTKAHCSRGGGEALPKGIIVETTDLRLRSLVMEKDSKFQPKEAVAKNLLAMAVGIKQKKVVNDIVQKFPLSNFTIMLFHYDGVVDQWHDLAWSNQSIHIVGLHQTKWWFAKRFMHPDIVAEYNYVFLWDEDLGVEHFHADKYLEIMEAEGFEISQPALDPASSDIHHMLTRRQASGRAHTMVMANHGTTLCNKDSNGPPCTGYVEVMAPVFSKAAWRCIWHMVQNDLVHGWGIDFKIGYCAQGVRSEKVGVIDAEYILHKGIPSLGGPRQKNVTTAEQKKQYNNSLRSKVRKRSGAELTTFLQRWKKAAEEDASWMDPFPPRNDSSANYHKV
ncbi:hypothetical protein KC19_8G028400 [Ceratodon purpureus]|uniref:Uncharacterized protein n=1 Tax=Ceratodon purpureus TaxID=3225 RepID=A0A8T0GUP8_CERPU|nr:hypothetical protein KC19_8G028400 [Ceratodon purpureus]